MQIKYVAHFFYRPVGIVNKKLHISLKQDDGVYHYLIPFSKTYNKPKNLAIKEIKIIEQKR